MKIIKLFILFGMIFTGCDTALPPQPEENTEFLILEAYLREGSTASNVSLKKSGTYLDQEMLPVENARVKMHRNGKKFPYYVLEPASRGFSYWLDESDRFELHPGEVIEVFAYSGKHRLYAETLVPERPKLNYSFLRDTLFVSRDEMEKSSVIMEIQWEDEFDPEARYFVEVRVWDESSRTWEDNQFPPYYVDENRLPLKNKWNFYNYIFYTDYVTTSTFSMIHFDVFRVYKEFTDLYEAVNTKTLNDASGPSNVEGGKGIFTALAGMGFSQLIEIVP